MEQKITVGGHINTYINFAMQQNYVPIVRNIIINNESEEKLENLRLKITFEPDFAREFTYEIGAIEAGKSMEIAPVRIILSTEFLFSLTEKTVGNIFIEVLQNEDKIYEAQHELEILTYDQWTGSMIMPEFIAAFITPNHPKINEVLTKAASYLEKWGKQPKFTGYQTKNPNNVKIQMAAIYAALQEQKIIYNNPPASYEVMGQRVRLSHIVLEKKEGTCLDLAILYASCMEAVGLYPLIVFIKGHAFAGCWLDEQTFADCVEDDVSALQKRAVKGSEELLLVECTDFVSGKNVDFEHALKHGNDHLIKEEDFHCVIDVKRTRGSGIRPIPLRLEQAQIFGNDSEDGTKSDASMNIDAPKDLEIREMADLSQVEENLTKQKVWERKLLDFSLRNSLLNFRPNKNSLQIMTADLGSLEDELANGKDFRIMEIPSEWTIPVRDIKIFEIENEKDLINTIASEEFKNNRIRTFLTAEELTKNLKNIYRAAKVSMEENGTNTLFLALGFLKWFETDLSEKARYAPIVLIPIDIVKSVKNGGYVIRSRQEDAQINITLLEYLRQIFGLKIAGLDPLPTDEHGIDLPLVFHTIRKAIMGKKNWNIENFAFVGLFSFGQFVMWNDIRNRSKELEANKVVSSLIEGKMNWEPGEKTVSLENLDVVVEPDKMAIPMSADSSQMVAIAAAAAGESFVLHGPPGTGKSQTITNMIANALYQGKSVLFVAEKMAALNVVQNRLASIGLDPFCLELHSNKTNKSSVLGQLNKALEVGRIKAPEEYKATADKIFELRKGLNSVVEALHCKREYGKTLYEAIERYEATKQEKGKIECTNEVIASATADSISKWNEAIREYSVAINDVTKYLENPLKGYQGREYSIELRDEFEKDLTHILTLAENAMNGIEKLCQWVGVTENRSMTVAGEFICVEKFILDKAPTFKDIIRSGNFEAVTAQIREVCQDGISYNALNQEIKDNFEEQIFTYNVNDAIMRYKKADMSWFLPKMMGVNKLVKELKLYAKNPAIITKDNIYKYYEKISNLAQLKTKLSQTSPVVKDNLGSLYMDLNSDWNNIISALDKAKGIHDFVGNVHRDRQSLYVNAIWEYDGAKEILDSIAAVKEFKTEVETLAGKYTIDFSEQNEALNWCGAFISKANAFKENLSSLKNWIVVQQKAYQLKELGIDCVNAAWKQDLVDSSSVMRAFECNLYYGLVLKTVREDVRLKEFQGRQYEDMIAKYTELIEKFRRLTIQELVAKLSANVPITGTSSAASSEIGILKKAIKSNGRMLSIRKLFDDIPTLLRRLCPCMLMSPISVAQYIDPSFPKFDLVIFDEASQLPTSEAVGTIARGENVVIVGDPKQLPPTSFFSSNRIDEDNADMEDLESLLDDCLSISMPQEHLKWHYRSRHESLIAYSNMQYYDNKLYTFPSPSDLVSEVKYVPVDGFYDKGKSKHNKAEAQAVVDEIIRRLSDEKLRNDSIGVVTFSSVQQNLIDDMLSDAFAKNHALEEFDRNSKEPVFVKNLENVQGDERDIILFSIGYGPDKNGNVSMNFGPLNREGGWRRLNVAISRARKSMIVYSTLKPEHINLSRTRAEGVAGLKGFLEFAMRGKNTLATKADSVGKHQDMFVPAIAKAIEDMGYEVKCNIGCSEYKMDIGVVNKDNPGTYLLGILVDGENCKEAVTSKDRFVLQPSVLKGLGWKLMRVWTLEWLDDSSKVLSDIKAEIENAVNTIDELETIPEENVKEELVFEKMEIDENTTVGNVYASFKVEKKGESEAFYTPMAQRSIVALAKKIIEKEAPISRKTLIKKVVSAWDISRVGSRAEASFDEAMKKVEKIETVDGENVFYWSVVQNPNEYTGYRVEDADGNKRSMDDIASQEIINAIKEVLDEQISLSKEDLIRETAKKFGYTRLGSVIETAVTYAINSAMTKGIVVVDEAGKVTKG